MADPVVALALCTLRDFLIEETKFLYGVRNQVRGLETQLKEMRCLLKDAERRKHESNTVQNWIAEIRDFAYRAEDVVETYAVEILSRKGKGFGELIKRFSCAFNECLSIHQIGSQLSEIKSEIERVHKSMQAYGIKEIIQGESSSVSCASNENQQWKRQTYPIEIEDCFVGKEDDLNRLVSLIVDDKQHRVISIWGMGGIGKTTIARKVYNHFETQRWFESFAWVCITLECQIRSVLEDVLKQLIPQQRADIMNLSNTELVQLLCEVQKAKRCLIVLDDLWRIDHWNGLKNALIVTGLENKILLTTRKQNIAAVGFSYELQLLNVDDGWELLKKKAFSLNKVPGIHTLMSFQLKIEIEGSMHLFHIVVYTILLLAVLFLHDLTVKIPSLDSFHKALSFSPCWIWISRICLTISSGKTFLIFLAFHVFFVWKLFTSTLGF